MLMSSEIIKRVRKELEYERAINLHRYPVRMAYVDGALMLEGEVEHIAAKKRAVRLAGAVRGVKRVVDSLRVMPSERKGDGAIRVSLTTFLTGELELRGCTLRTRGEGGETLRAGPEDGGVIEVSVDQGVITLEGKVGSLSHKRVAGVLAWWTPGCRDVVNALVVEPAEEDNDGELLDALALVLEMDPLVQSERVKVSCRNRTVTLEGCVRSAEEARRVECDAWFVFGVEAVVNRLEIGTPARASARRSHPRRAVADVNLPNMLKKSAAPTTRLTPEERRRMIAEAAYYLAERRGFAPGAELDDWLEAERSIDRMRAVSGERKV